MDGRLATRKAFDWLKRSRHIQTGRVKPVGAHLELAREMAGFAMSRFQDQIMGRELWNTAEHQVGFGPSDAHRLVHQMEAGRPGNRTECFVMPVSVTEEQEVEYIILAWKPYKPDMAQIKRIRKADGSMKEDFRTLVNGLRHDSTVQGSGSGMPSEATNA